MVKLISWIFFWITFSYLVGRGTYIFQQDYPNHKRIDMGMLIFSSIIFSFSISAELIYPDINSVVGISTIHMVASLFYIFCLMIFDLMGEFQASIQNKKISISLTVGSVIISIITTIIITNW